MVDIFFCCSIIGGQDIILIPTWIINDRRMRALCHIVNSYFRVIWYSCCIEQLVKKRQRQTFYVGINRILWDRRNVPKKSQMLQIAPHRITTSLVQVYVGQKETALTTDGWPFCTIFLHRTSLKRCDNQPQHTRTGKNIATMVAEPPSSPATWSWWINAIQRAGDLSMVLGEVPDEE